MSGQDKERLWVGTMVNDKDKQINYIQLFVEETIQIYIYYRYFKKNYYISLYFCQTKQVI